VKIIYREDESFRAYYYRENKREKMGEKEGEGAEKKEEEGERGREKRKAEIERDERGFEYFRVSESEIAEKIEVEKLDLCCCCCYYYYYYCLLLLFFLVFVSNSL